MSAKFDTRWFRQRFRELARELREARRQEHKPRHLKIRADRASIQAARLVIEGVNACVFNPRLRIREDLRFAWTGKISGRDGKITFDHGGRMHVQLVAETLEDDGAPLPIETASDKQLARLWVFPILAMVKAFVPSSLKANAGAYDYKTARMGDQGQLLDIDGKPRGYVKEIQIDPDSGDPVCNWQLSGEQAYVGDDYDDADSIAHLRASVGDWADACSALADLIADSKTEKERAGRPPVPQKDMLPVKICGELLLRDVSGITLKKAMARVSDAGNKGKFLTNGKKGRERRIERVSFEAWRLEQRDRDLDADDEGLD